MGAIAGPVAVAFPGQGGDWAAAVASLSTHRDHPLVTALADRLGTDRWDQLRAVDARHAQPAIFVAGLVRAEKVDRGEVAVAMGLSLGEITAAAWSGAIEPVDGLDLTVTRARLAHTAAAARPASMAAVMRWGANEVARLRRTVLDDGAPDEVLEVAVRNSDTQVVLTGDDASIKRAVERANAAGAVARILPIGGGYHCRLLEGQLDEFAAAVGIAVTADPAVPVACSTAAEPCADAAALVRTLALGLVTPADWPRTVDAARRLGARRGIDIGPGDTLVRLGRHLPDLPMSGVT